MTEWQNVSDKYSFFLVTESKINLSSWRYLLQRTNWIVSLDIKLKNL